MRSIYSIYPLVLAGATAGTGIMGELPDLPSLSMTHRRLPQAWVYYVTREGESEGPPEIWARILWSSQEEQLEPDANVWRGVFAPSYHRKVMFSEPMELQTSKLPRWKPRVIIDRRMLERAEDE
jgi:hypothetical protein